MTTATRARPDAVEYALFYAGYVSRVPAGDILELLRADGGELVTAVEAVPESRAGHRYAEGKWTVREVLGHMIDAERIFTYRALRIARGDRTPLPGFEENDYVRASGSDARTVVDLAEESRAVRDATVRLFASMPDEAWTRRGVASGCEVSVRALAFITAGHARHHLAILRERYLIG